MCNITHRMQLFVDTVVINLSEETQEMAMLVALMALTMSIALMVSTLVMIHHEGQTNKVDRKKTAFQNH